MNDVALDLNAARQNQTIEPRPRKSFVATPAVRNVTDRALHYLQAGYPVHLRGPSGTGKTTLAFHVASQMGRPIMLITGDEEFKTSDLVGGTSGMKSKRVVDRYISSVVKIEENVDPNWVDNRLTTACVDGCILIYDEFTRSRPAANNVLLSVLEERLLVLPNASSTGNYVKVHPDFRAIFTSNPVEYVGVHKSQDALADRMITIDIDGYDRVTEVAITVAHSGLRVEDAAIVVDIIRALRSSKICRQEPTVRTAIMIGRILALGNIAANIDEPRFVQTCRDVLESKIGEISAPNSSPRSALNAIIGRVCGARNTKSGTPESRGHR